MQSNGVSTLTEKERRLAGADWKLSYVPLRNNQFSRITWGTEVLYSDGYYMSDPDGVPANGDEHNKSVGSTGLYSYLDVEIASPVVQRVPVRLRRESV